MTDEELTEVETEQASAATFGWYRLENGTVQKMDHPLHEGIGHRVELGIIVRVPAPDDAEDAEADDYVTPGDPDKPKPTDVKAAWVNYAIRLGLDSEQALGMTKLDLAEWCEGEANRRLALDAPPP